MEQIEQMASDLSAAMDKELLLASIIRIQLANTPSKTFQLLFRCVSSSLQKLVSCSGFLKPFYSCRIEQAFVTTMEL